MHSGLLKRRAIWIRTIRNIIMYVHRCRTVPVDLAALITQETAETMICALFAQRFGVWIPAANVWAATVSAAAE